MSGRFSGLFSDFFSRWIPNNTGVQKSHEDIVFQAVEQAKQDWLNARSYFDNVVDPDLVDVAIYSMDAAERKYMYLLKQAKAVQAQMGKAAGSKEQAT